MFLCNGGRGHSGEFVYIRDDREVTASVEYFSLCEVQIFGMEGKFNEAKTVLLVCTSLGKVSILIMLRPGLTFRLIYKAISLIYFLPFCQFIKCSSRLVVQQLSYLGCSPGST